MADDPILNCSEFGLRIEVYNSQESPRFFGFLFRLIFGVLLQPHRSEEKFRMLFWLLLSNPDLRPEWLVKFLEVLLGKSTHFGVEVELHLSHKPLGRELFILDDLAEFRVKKFIESCDDVPDELDELLLDIVFLLSEP